MGFCVEVQGNVYLGIITSVIWSTMSIGTESLVLVRVTGAGGPEVNDISWDWWIARWDKWAPELMSTKYLADDGCRTYFH